MCYLTIFAITFLTTFFTAFFFGAGFFRRALALDWQRSLAEDIRTAQSKSLAFNESKSWAQFAQKYRIAFEQGSDALFKTLRPSLDKQAFTQESLEFFNTSETAYGQADSFFAQIPEMLAVPQLLLMLQEEIPASLNTDPLFDMDNGMIYEGKIATALHKIRKFAKDLEPLFDTAGLVVIRIFLEVADPMVKNFRVFFRDFKKRKILMPAYTGTLKEEEQFTELKTWLSTYPNLVEDTPTGYDPQVLFTWLEKNLIHASELISKRTAEDWVDYPSLYEKEDGQPVSPTDLVDEQVIKIDAGQSEEKVLLDALEAIANTVQERKAEIMLKAQELRAQINTRSATA